MTRQVFGGAELSGCAAPGAGMDSVRVVVGVGGAEHLDAGRRIPGSAVKCRIPPERGDGDARGLSNSSCVRSHKVQIRPVADESAPRLEGIWIQDQDPELSLKPVRIWIRDPDPIGSQRM